MKNLGHKFKPGQPKPPGSGRKKGTPNKKKLASVSQILAERGLDPIAELLIELPQIEDAKDRAKIWLELISYCQAKPKACEDPPVGEIDPAEFEHVSDAELIKLVHKEGV